MELSNSSVHYYSTTLYALPATIGVDGFNGLLGGMAASLQTTYHHTTITPYRLTA